MHGRAGMEESFSFMLAFYSAHVEWLGEELLFRKISHFAHYIITFLFHIDKNIYFRDKEKL